MDYIVPVSIFISTFIVVCILYDFILFIRMQRRMDETIKFIASMKDFELETRIPFT